MKDREKWLASLEVGNEVAIKGTGGLNNKWTSSKIEKITPTKIMEMTNGKKFNSNGRERGNKSVLGDSLSIYPMTPDLLDLIEREELTTKFKMIKPQELSLEHLREIVQILKP